MKAGPRAEFEKWYYANKDNPFDFQKELEYYCHLDVDILTKGCLRFRELLMKVCFALLLLSLFFVYQNNTFRSTRWTPSRAPSPSLPPACIYSENDS